MRGVEGCEALLLHAADRSPRVTVVELQFTPGVLEVLRAPNLEVESGSKIGLGY